MKLFFQLSFFLAAMVGDSPSSSSFAYLQNYTNLTFNTNDFKSNMIYQNLWSLIMISNIFSPLQSKAGLRGWLLFEEILFTLVFKRFPSPVDQSFSTGVSDVRFSYRQPVFLGNNYSRLWGLWSMDWQPGYFRIFPVWAFKLLLQVKEICQQ